MTTIRLYSSYSFTNKDPVIDEMRTIVKDSGLSYEEIRARSGVSPGTLAGWFDKKTRKPQSATVEAVGRACGMQRKWVPLSQRAIHEIDKAAEAKPKRKRKAKK